MSVDLSEDELSTLLGSDVFTETDNNVSANEGEDGISIVRSYLKKVLVPLQKEFSKVLGEEVALTIASIEETKGLHSEIQKSYVSRGNFTNNGHLDHIYIFPSDVAVNLAQKYLGIEDVTDSEDQIVHPIAELGQKLIDIIAGVFENGFKGNIGPIEALDNINDLDESGNFVKVQWSLGESVFEEFFDVNIVDFLKNIKPENADSMSDNNMPNIDFETQGTEESNSGGEIFGNLGENEDINISLGEALLGLDSQPISDVSMPSFEEDSKTSTVAGSSNINMLMDVNMTVTVELGNTSKSVGEILDLNRGSIIELKKLAGEPLDIKVNQKLIAKGEVVVIDEYFGVRIIEVLSPDDIIHMKR